MKPLTKKLFLIACTIVLLALCSNLKSQQILVEGAVSNGWEYSIMQVTGGSSYAYDVKPTTTLSGSVTIPDYLGGCPVEALAEGAFKNNTGITYLYVPSTLTNICSSAFSGCSNLKNIICSQTQNYAKFTIIGDNAFYKCSSLYGINFSDTTYIGSNAFDSCASLASPDLSNATTIGRYAFSKCSSITDVTFCKKRVEIGISAFNNCTRLKSITFQNEDVCIPTLCFWACSALQDIRYSEYTNSIKIKPTAFNSCTALTELYFPASVEIINDAFQGCKNITEIVFDGDATISGNPGGAFSNAMCVAGGSIHCKGNLSIDSSSVFSNCTGLNTLICEKNLVIEGMWNLADCDNLTSITVNGNFTNNDSNTYYSANQPMTLTVGGELVWTGDSNVKTAIFKGNTKQLIHATTMIFEDTATCVSGTIDGNVTEEVIFYNPSTNLDGITLSGEEKKTKFYGLKGSTAETLFEKYKDNSYFCNLILSDWDFRVSAEHNTFDWNTGEAMPKLTPEMLGLTVQVTYYKEASARNISYSPKDPLKGYQLEIPDLKEGENTISVKYSGWSKNLTITLQNKKQMLPATSTPTVLVTQTPSATSTVSATQTLSPTSTVSATQTLSPTSTVSVTQTPSATSTVSATQTLSPTSTVSVAQTPSATSTTPTLSPTSTVSVSTGGAVVRYPSPTLKASETQPPNPTSAAPKVSDFPEVTATPKVPQKNKTYFVKNIKYKVLSFKGKTGTASIVGYNKAASSLQLTSTVKIFNYTLRVTKINAKAFRNCQKLFGKLVIPKYVTSIGSSAFYNCKKLTSVTLPKRLTSIGASAFQNCKNLQYVIINGKNIKKVGKKAFFNNSKVPARKFNMPTKYISYYRKIFIYKKQYN